MLKRSVEEWNWWREKNWRATKPDLSGVDLSNNRLYDADFEGLELVDADFTAAMLMDSTPSWRRRHSRSKLSRLLSG